MRRYLFALALATALPASAANRAEARKASTAYEEARRAYYALKADAKRRQYRHQWLAVVDRFEEVAKYYPDAEKAPDALYTSAELLSDLSHLSMLPEDVQRAAADYRRVMEKHPKHRLADDAALMLARIYAQRLDQPEQALQLLIQAEKQLPRGDCWKEIHALRGRLADSVEPAPPPSPAPAAPSPAVAKAAAPVPTPDKTPEKPKAKAKPPLVEVQKAAEVAFDADGHPTIPAPPTPPAPAPTAAQAAHALAKLNAGRDKDITLAEQLGPQGPAGGDRRRPRRARLGRGRRPAASRRRTSRWPSPKKLARRSSSRRAWRSSSPATTTASSRLEERAALANEAHGDLFISIHCNSAAHRELRGIETYTLNTAARPLRHPAGGARELLLREGHLRPPVHPRGPGHQGEHRGVLAPGRAGPAEPGEPRFRRSTRA